MYLYIFVYIYILQSIVGIPICQPFRRDEWWHVSWLSWSLPGGPFHGPFRIVNVESRGYPLRYVRSPGLPCEWQLASFGTGVYPIKSRRFYHHGISCYISWFLFVWANLWGQSPFQHPTFLTEAKQQITEGQWGRRLRWREALLGSYRIFVEGVRCRSGEEGEGGRLKRWFSPCDNGFQLEGW